MGCLKLSYHQRDRGLEITSPNFLQAVGEKKYSPKKCVDYFTGGSILPGRSFNSNAYRFGYNKGSEKDEEVKGSGNTYYTKYRMYDSRLLRWMSVDPKAAILPGLSPYMAMDGNPVLFNDPDGDIVPLITGFAGAAAGALYGVFTGKSGKEIAAYAAGGFVAGATLGIGTLGVVTAGGIATIGGANTAMIMGASGIVGSMLGNATEQAVNNIGTDNSINGEEVLVSGVYGIPDAVMGGVVSKISKGVSKGLTNYFSTKFSEKRSSQALKSLKRDISKDLRSQGLGRRQANKAANKAIDQYKTVLDDDFKVTEIGVKVTENIIEVTLSGVQVGLTEEMKTE